MTVPKFVSGSTSQRPKSSHADGASAIHSAEDTSGASMVSFRVKIVFRVRFRSRSETVWPVTVTVAEIRSPARIFSFS